MATPRRLLMNPAFSEVFHCTSRCVRRAFLCGWDPASGRDFEHRRLWIDERISELALYFGISVISSSFISNHFHIVPPSRRHPRPAARTGRITRPVVAPWSRRRPPTLYLPPATTLLPPWRWVYDWPVPLTGPSAHAHDRSVRDPAREFRSFRQKSGCLQLFATPPPKATPLFRVSPWMGRRRGRVIEWWSG